MIKSINKENVRRAITMPKRNEKLIADIKEEELGIKKLSDFSAQEQDLYERLDEDYGSQQLNRLEIAYENVNKKYQTIAGGLPNAHSANVVQTTKAYQEKIDKVIGEEHPEYQWEKEIATLKTENEKISEERDALNEQWEQYVLNFSDKVEIVNLGDLDTIYGQMVDEIDAENKKREEESKQQGQDDFIKANKYNTSVNTILTGEAQRIVNDYYEKSNEYYKNADKIDELNGKISDFNSQKKFEVVKDPYASEKVNALKKERDKKIAENDAQLRKNKNEQLKNSEKINNLGKYIEIRKSISSNRASIDGDKKNAAWAKLNEKQAEFDKLNWWQQFWAKRLPADWYGKAELFQEIEARKEVMKDIGYSDNDITDRYKEYNKKKAQEAAQKEKEEREMEKELQKNKEHAAILKKRADEKMAQWKADAEKEKQNQVRENVGDMFAKDTNVGGFAKEGEQKSEVKQNDMQKGSLEMKNDK